MNVNTSAAAYSIEITNITSTEAASLLKAVVFALENGSLTSAERQPANTLRLALVDMLAG